MKLIKALTIIGLVIFGLPVLFHIDLSFHIEPSSLPFWFRFGFITSMILTLSFMLGLWKEAK